MRNFFMFWVVVVISIVPMRVFAIDCIKVRSLQEKIICSNSGLLKLDQDLNKFYAAKIVLTDSLDAEKLSQKVWLSDVRSTCKTVEFLDGKYKSRIQDLALQIIKMAETCEVKEAQLMGEWSGERYARFDEFEFAKDNVFNSWLGGHPEYVNGGWSLKKSSCTLAIKVVQGERVIVSDYFAVHKGAGRLVMISTDGKSVSVYEKLNNKSEWFAVGAVVLACAFVLRFCIVLI